MSNQSLGNAFSQRFQQKADILHIAHHLFRGTTVVGVEIAHRGGEEDVVKRFGKLFGVYYAQRALKPGQVSYCVFMAQSSFPLSSTISCGSKSMVSWP